MRSGADARDAREKTAVAGRRKARPVAWREEEADVAVMPAASGATPVMRAAGAEVPDRRAGRLGEFDNRVRPRQMEEAATLMGPLASLRKETLGGRRPEVPSLSELRRREAEGCVMSVSPWTSRPHSRSGSGHRRIHRIEARPKSGAGSRWTPARRRCPDRSRFGRIGGKTVTPGRSAVVAEIGAAWKFHRLPASRRARPSAEILRHAQSGNCTSSEPPI